MTDVVVIPIDVHRYRVLFSDGRVQDFLAHRDTSTAREVMLAWARQSSYEARIVPGDSLSIQGISDLGVEYTWTTTTSATLS
jgi:hypothetical protein